MRIYTRPFISVLLPVYNGEKFLHKAIGSIVSQTFSNFELIIINDGSTDRTNHILRQFKDKRLKVIVLPIKQGIAKALNIGLKKSQGTFIARMDADDISYPQRFEKQMNFLLQNPQVGVVGSGVEKIDENGKLVGKEIFQNDHASLSRAMIYANPLRHSTVLIRKSLLNRLGSYDEELEGAEDYDLWLRLILHTQFATLPEVLVKYRISKSSVSYKENRRIEKAYSKAKIKSIFEYGYPWWHLLFVLKSFISQIIPVSAKQYLYSKVFKY